MRGESHHGQVQAHQCRHMMRAKRLADLEHPHVRTRGEYRGFALSEKILEARVVNTFVNNFYESTILECVGCDNWQERSKQADADKQLLPFRLCAL